MGTSEQRVVTEAYTRRWPDHFNLVLGAWLVLAPLSGIGAVADTAAWNSYLVGLAVVVFSLAALAHPDAWKERLNLVLGVWLVLAPGSLGFIAQSGPTWNQVVVGFAIGANALRAAAQGPGKFG